MTAFFPTIGLSGAGGFQSINVGTVIDLPSTFWALGSSLSVPLFEGGKLQANLRRARSAYEETLARYPETVLMAFAEVENNLAAQDLLRRQYEAESSAMQSAGRERQIAENKYRAGPVTFLNVAGTEVTLLGLRRNLVSLRGEQLVAAVALVKSLGGVWPPPDRVESH